MAKEYIERDAVVKELQEELDYESLGYTKEQNKYIDIGLGIALRTVKRLPAADVIEVMRGEDSVLAELENDYKDFKKIKTHLAQIIVKGKIEKPYYSILWWDEESKEYNIGYSSYCLDYVRKWLELVFEVVDPIPTADVVEPVKHGRWITVTKNMAWKCSDCGKLSCCEPNYCPNCGAKMRSDDE